MQNPALEKFLQLFRGEEVLAQVSIQRSAGSFELRHVENRDAEKASLRSVPENELRPLVDFTEEKAFRPLKSAPNLPRGWRFTAKNPDALELALNTFYPGALADWFAVNFRDVRPTSYREFTHRQTGMYRVTAMLTDAQAAPMIRACCHPKFCLKQRWWSVGDLSPDAPGCKSLIPCLEPCAILLEFARKIMRLEQAAASGEKILVKEKMTAVSEMREADFENPQNPRRVQWLAEKK
ncbi:MAG: DR2241 family protein [Verrucomicrobiota bacterium]